MDDSFQFIIESPQHNQGHKKRPRLVTSCDNCRLKKIKCLQPSPETKCEACKASKIPCRFRDRERYFAERSRAIAGPNAGSGYGEDQRSEGNPALDAFSAASGSSSPSIHSNPRSNSHSPKASGLVSPEGEGNGRYQSYPPDPRRPMDPPHRHAGYGFVPPPSVQPLHNPRSSHHHSSSRQVHLFDPEHPQCPHPTLMPHFIQTFFEQFSQEYTFLSYQEIIGEFWDRTLPPLLSNCIAAMASRCAHKTCSTHSSLADGRLLRFSNLPELTVRGLHNVAETYADNAKTILSSVAHIPTMDTLHALILLSWSEYKNNRVTGFRAYYQTAMRMAMDLGLSDQNAVQMHLSETERDRRRSTWAHILQMHMTASSYNR
ncbi:hypothetical protein BDZ94DRAFT_1318757 [Collybia nuda]|uniref:Zn(2)-C6 fungal-type domain-containing protein n=1 Tax=Collybia nuda TaxID=64659 RepID=A0A9P6CP56_9AGAR|nr:hypothetical protein BDZ94DRAFT_1318757 [Collybia nuda]